MSEQIEAKADFGHRPRRLVTNWGTWEVRLPVAGLVTMKLTRDEQSGTITPSAHDAQGNPIEAEFVRLDGEGGVQ
jgi:hypothetical protein